MKKIIIIFTALLILLNADEMNFPTQTQIPTVAQQDQTAKKQSPQKEAQKTPEQKSEEQTQQPKQNLTNQQNPQSIYSINIQPKDNQKSAILTPEFLKQINEQNQLKEQIKPISQEELQVKINQCEQNNNLLSCFDVGMIYYQGRTFGGQNLKKAFYFLDFSCEGDQKLGCYEAGVIKANLTKDYYKAFMFFDRACQARDLRGCRNLAVLFYHGWGVAKQPQLATSLLKKNCADGDKPSCQKYYFVLAKAYQQSQNLQGAKKYYKKSCELQNKDACQKLYEVIELERKLYDEKIIQDNVLKTPTPSLQSPKRYPMQHK